MHSLKLQILVSKQNVKDFVSSKTLVGFFVQLFLNCIELENQRGVSALYL